MKHVTLIDEYSITVIGAIAIYHLQTIITPGMINAR